MPALSPEQVRLVLRRAAELEKRPERDAAEGEASEAEVAEIAAEVGIEPQAVKHALAELHAGLVKAEPGEKTFLDSLVGAGEITASRSVPGTVDEVRQAVTRYMQAQLMHMKRNLGERGQIWEAGGDMWSRMRRAFSFGQRIAMQSGTEVEVTVVPRPGVEREVLVRMTARLVEPRRRRAWQAGAGAAAGVGLAALGVAAFHTVGPEVASIIAGAGTAAGSLAAVRSGQRRDLGEVEVALLRFLDGLEHGEVPAPPSARDALHRLLRRTL